VSFKAELDEFLFFEGGQIAAVQRMAA
jgi:hypothetical protein